LELLITGVVDTESTYINLPLSLLAPAINVNLEKKGVTTGVIDTGDQFACLSLPLAVNLYL
jgi:hypothetical protein